jgi:hypothetical protein
MVAKVRTNVQSSEYPALASLVLTVVGTAIAGPFGGLAGGLIGTYLDQAFIFPALFGRPSGPRLEDLQVQTASEGSNGRYILGPQNRTAGTLIWATDFKESSNSSKKGPTTYTYSCSYAVYCGEGPARKIKRIWADTKVIYEDGVIDSRVGDIRIYKGTSTQTADPLMEAADPGNTPAYRDTAYFVIEDLQLLDWGNRTPNFSFEYVSDVQMPVQTAVKEILQRAGLAEAEIDTSRIGSCLRGYVVLGPQETVRILNPLMTAFSLGGRDSGGVLQFFKRGQEDEYGEIPLVDLGAHEEGQKPKEHPVLLTDSREFNLPSEVVVQYINPDNDLQQGSQRHRRVGPTSTDVVSLTLPITLKNSEASELSKTILWSGYSERQLIEASLPPSHMRIQEGDIVRLPISTDTVADVRVIEVNRGFNMLTTIRGHVTDKATYTQTSVVDDNAATPDVEDPPFLNWFVLDIPALATNHTGILGFYAAAAFVDGEYPWRGAKGFKSLDNADFDEGWTHTIETPMGYTVNALAADGGATDLWLDEINTVDVYLYEGELASTTLDNMLAGVNRMLVGSEIIGFQTATFLGNKTYRLSNLLRGLRDTKDAIGTHIPNERAVVLEVSKLVFNTGLEQADVGSTRYYKIAASGENLLDVDALEHVPKAATFRHFTPCHLEVSRDETNDNVSISWVRRSRGLAPPLSVGSGPLLDDIEEYLVEIRLAYSTPLRQTTLSEITSFTYTAAMQTEDGLTPGTTAFWVFVYQRSSVAGLSKPAIQFFSPTA